MAVRRLPVLQNAPDEGDPVRPSWQWVLLGITCTISVWLPLAVLSLALVRALVPGGRPPTAGWQSGCLLLASQAPQWIGALAAGELVGTFGKGTRPRHALLCGALTPLLALAMGSLELPGLALALSVVPVLLGSLFCWVGYRDATARLKRASAKPRL